MTKIASMFSELDKSGGKAFIPFLPAGDPDIDTTVEVARLLIREGASLLEIGFPYSDPIADGPVIQAAYSRALDKGVRLDDMFDCIRRIITSAEATTHSTPVVGMVSITIIDRMGLGTFLNRAKEVGIDGLIVPDLPLEESSSIAERVADSGLALIQLVTPTTPIDRADEIAKRSSGFVYCVSVKGITGERKELPPELSEQLARLRERTPLPLCVGFGVSRPEHVEQLRDRADGVIVGSAYVRKLEELTSRSREEVLTEIADFTRSMVAAANP